MAFDIAAHLRRQVQDFSETLDNLSRLQAVTASCHHAEDNEDAWMLRQHFMAIAEKQWQLLSDELLQRALPLLAPEGGDAQK